MSELAPFAPGRALEGPIGFPRTISHPRGPQCPPCLAPLASFRKFQGFADLAIVLRTVLEYGVPLWLAVPNAMAESLGLAGPALRMRAMCQWKRQALAASNTRLWQEHRPRRSCS